MRSMSFEESRSRYELERRPFETVGHGWILQDEFECSFQT